MIVRCISYTGDRATVVLEPCWLARLFSSRTLTVDLERRRVGEQDGRTLYGDWYAPASGRSLDRLPNDAEIRNALDFREIGSPARRSITAGAGTEAVAP